MIVIPSHPSKNLPPLAAGTELQHASGGVNLMT